MLEDFLEYQKLDGQILRLKRKLSEDPERQKMNQVLASAKSFQNKLAELEIAAQKAIGDYEKNKKQYDKLLADFETLSRINNADFSADKIDENIEKLNVIASDLSNMERTLSALQETIVSVLKNFDVCRNNIVASRQKYNDLKTNVSKLEGEVNAEVEKYAESMKKIEKNLNPELLAKYNKLRQDKIFPVFVPLNNNSCGGCSMTIPAALMNKLLHDGHLECEQCRRYIYKS